MIGIANQKLWNLGVGLLSKWNRPYFFLLRVIFYRDFFYIHIVYPSRQPIFFMPRTSFSARLGQNSRASTSISSIAKMRSSSCH